MPQKSYFKAKKKSEFDTYNDLDNYAHNKLVSEQIQKLHQIFTKKRQNEVIELENIKNNYYAAATKKYELIQVKRKNYYNDLEQIDDVQRLAAAEET